MLNNPSDFQDKIVLDVGCGTGILSIFAIHAGAKHVYAIDACDISLEAQKLIDSNKLTDRITVIKSKIEDAVLPVPHVDVIISEWMGYFLVYESMLESVLFARDKWLKPDGKMYPSTANIFITPFTDEEYYEDRVDFWGNMYGIDFSVLKPAAKKSAFCQPQIEYLAPEGQLAFPQKILRIDCKKDSYADIRSWNAEFDLLSVGSGRMNGLMAHFTVEFNGTDETLILSTSPDAEPTHWHQTLFYFDEPIQVSQDSVIQGKIQVQQHHESHRFINIQMDCSVDKKTISKLFELK